MIATPLIITGGILFFCGLWSFPIVTMYEGEKGYRAAMRGGVAAVALGLVAIIASLFIGSINEGWFA